MGNRERGRARARARRRSKRARAFSVGTAAEMAFSRLSTGRSQNSHHSAEFACELGGKGSGGIVAITRAPLTRTMSGHVVDSLRGLSEVPLNHGGAPPTRRSKRTMSQIRRVCPPDAELKRRIRKVLLADPDMRFGSAVTMDTRQRCMKQLEVRRRLRQMIPLCVRADSALMGAAAAG